VLWAIGLIGAFYLMTLALGFGAARLLDTGPRARSRTSAATWPRRCSPKRSAAVRDRRGRRPAGADLGGRLRDDPRGGRRPDPDLGVSVAHDLYANVVKTGSVTEKDEVEVARIAAFVIGGIAIALAIPAQKLNIAFLVALAFAVAASANLPSISTTCSGAVQHPRRHVGDLRRADLCVGLVFFSPVVSGLPGRALFPLHDWSWFPLSNPGIISIPLGFFSAGWARSRPRSRSRGPLHRARGARPHRRGRRAGGRALRLRR
jgi:cation/acetate symporter